MSAAKVSELERAYADASAEWDASPDAELRDTTTADGLDEDEPVRRPRLGIGHSGDGTLSERVDEVLAEGFGR